MNSQQMSEPASSPTKIHALFSSWSVNIGDDIQTLAVETLHGRVEGYIDREFIASHHEPALLVANGWWKHREKDFPPHSNITPAYVGIHINCSNHFLERNIGHFKSVEPIGCRDPFTFDRLKRLGVTVYHSSCLTLGLHRWVPSDIVFPVVAVDVDPSVALPAESITLTHLGPASSHPDVMRQTSLSRLATYQQAGLVVTSRLHVALPCIAFGTPVILMVKNPKDPRFGVLRDIMPVNDIKGPMPTSGTVLSPTQREELRQNAKMHLAYAIHEAVSRQVLCMP